MEKLCELYSKNDEKRVLDVFFNQLSGGKCAAIFPEILLTAYTFVTLIPGITILVRRYRDAGKHWSLLLIPFSLIVIAVVTFALLLGSGAWALGIIVPAIILIIAAIFPIVVCCLPSVVPDGTPVV